MNANSAILQLLFPRLTKTEDAPPPSSLSTVDSSVCHISSQCCTARQKSRCNLHDEAVCLQEF